MSVINLWEELCNEFSQDSFFKLLAIDSSLPTDNSYTQARYLFNYLSECGCKSMVLEKNYTDKDYLNDYLHFYASCHQVYPKTCKRLHFFTMSVNSDLIIPEFTNVEELRTLQENYLGFAVIRPIPGVPIGKTVLKPYSATNFDSNMGFLKNIRNIFTTKKYEANLLGNSLKTHSLAFQQQDCVVSACATIALWSVLQKTSTQYGYYTPTTYEITQSANLKNSSARPIPSSGLQVNQVMDAIHYFGMELEAMDYYDDNAKFLVPDIFLSWCYAYLRGGFPIFLGIDIKGKGNHAISLLGYKLGEEHQEFNNNVNFIGNSIEKFYAHDDNIGPFARYPVCTRTFIERETGASIPILNLQRDEYIDQAGNFLEITPICAVIPLYHKIRYPFKDIKKFLFEFSEFIKAMHIFESKNGTADFNIAWDCYITEINEFKKNVITSNLPLEINPEDRKRILLRFAPRFIWRCSLFVNNVIFLDLIADATEAGTCNPFFIGFFYDSDVKSIFAKVLENSISISYFRDRSFYNFLLNQCRT